MHMTLQIGDVAPDFEADTTQGRIRFHEWIDGSWVVFFSHPKDFTPVCTTELGALARLKPEFEKRNVKVIELSVDSVQDHLLWSKDIAKSQGFAPDFPMIGDTDLKISMLYGMLPAGTTGESSKRTAVDNATVRTVFVIGTDKKIRLMLMYPMSAGRNFSEVLRVIDSLQLTAKHNLSTPADWTPGEDVVIPASVSDEQAKSLYPKGWKALTSYLRYISLPQ
jgi:alkyl hydroperoxide reductase subunit AhpC